MDGRNFDDADFELSKDHKGLGTAKSIVFRILRDPFSSVLPNRPCMRLKASFHFTTGKICEERAKKLHLEVDKKVIACISNLGLQQLKVFSSDLESFARHAKRTTVNADDVKLLARRNPKLLAHLFTLENKTGKSSRAEPAKKQQPSVKDFAESSAKKVVHSNASSSKATETANSSEMATGKGNKQNNPRKRKNCTTNNTEPFIV